MFYFNKITLLCITLLFAHECVAKIINLPEDYPSIQEAVEKAESGDEIQVNQHDVSLLKEQSQLPVDEIEGIIIKDKDLIIFGTTLCVKTKIQVQSSAFFYYSGSIDLEIPPESKVNLIRIENSDVIMKNLDMMGTHSLTLPFSFTFAHTAAPVQIKSGKLTFVNVIFRGVIKAFGNLELIDSVVNGISSYTTTSNSIIYPIPAIHIRNQTNKKFRIHNSDIICNNISGSRPIVIENVEDTEIQITQTTIKAGIHRNSIPRIDEVVSFWNYPDPFKGLSGIFIVNSSNLNIDLNQSEISGGFGTTTKNAFDNVIIPGGPGIEILNSNNIAIQYGKMIGKDGQKGYIVNPNDEFEIYITHSSDGGNAIHVSNSSVVLDNVELIPGIGGVGDPDQGILPGKDGIPFHQDEHSTVSFVTTVTDWSIH